MSEMQIYKEIDCVLINGPLKKGDVKSPPMVNDKP